MTTDHGAIPHLTVSDASAAIDFYTKAFGATEVARIPTPDGKRLMHAEIVLNGGRLFLVDDFPEYRAEGSEVVVAPDIAGSTSVTLHLIVPDCDKAVARAESAGARVVMEPQDAFWGDRYARIVDPFGHSWSLAHSLAAPAA